MTSDARVSSWTYFDMKFKNKFFYFLEKNKELPNIMLPLDSKYSSSISTLNTKVAVSINPKLVWRHT
jgi:hypothetical protein